MNDRPQMRTPTAMTVETESLLLWSWKGQEYAIAAKHVYEVMALPELLSPPEKPPSISGFLEYRGHLVPITDLDHLMQGKSHPYHLTDSIILIHVNNVFYGLVSEELQGLHQAATTAISTMNQPPDSQHSLNLILSGIVTIHTRRVLLLDSSDIAARLIEHPNSHTTTFRLDNEAANNFFSPNPSSHPYPLVSSSHDQDELRRRALQIREVPMQENPASQLTLAIIQLGQERFGIDLSTLRECAECAELTPIPCCPPHILGHTNHHGDILLVINIAEFLFDPTTFHTQGTKVVIVDLSPSCVAVAVHDILDIITIDAESVRPSVSWSPAEHEPLLKGLFVYDQKNLGLLDLHHFLTSETIIVNDNH